jgi:uncharacterized membrane protein
MSCYNSAGTGQFTNTTQVPSLYSNGTQYNAFSYSQFLESLNRNVPCGGATYLRPDVGGALLPWLYTVIALIVHLPIVLIRVARWDRVQILSIALATLTVAITLQVYHSTSLSPDKVLVWMPLTLPLDAGSMLQLAVLIIEDIGISNLWKSLTNGFRSKTSPPNYQMYEAVNKDNNTTFQQSEIRPRNDEENLSQKEDSDNSAKAMIAICAVVLFIIIVVLQIVGVIHASKGRNTPSLTVSWCSPIFELFAVAVSDGNCNFYPVSQNSGKGLGCINLPASRQKDWLLITVVLGSVAIVFQFLDFLILTLVHAKARWRSVKMKRPWFTVSNDTFPKRLVFMSISCLTAS